MNVLCCPLELNRDSHEIALKTQLLDCQCDKYFVS